MMQVLQSSEERRNGGVATATTIFAMAPGGSGVEVVGGHHDEGDLYMSFIDSDKFSPIQSVSGEEIDEDDSLGH